ncbi:unnamed protein product [Schistosoma margrebowiei]|uniref:Uncharacterized protein n=1 Tax=Schistosoma margrebowiei TaxID=48269 RepID=A0A3P8I5R6_9TREM|nr:unnamed protein product [Schistosoma margrebowiei]
MYSLQSIYGTLIRQWGSPRKVLTTRCDFDVSWFVTPFPSNSSRPPITWHRSSTLVIHIPMLWYDNYYS